MDAIHILKSGAYTVFESLNQRSSPKKLINNQEK